MCFNGKVSHTLNEPVHKPTICICDRKAVEQPCRNCTADPRLCFRPVDSAIALLTKSQGSNLLLRLYRPVCVGPGRKPKMLVKLLVFSHTGSNESFMFCLTKHLSDESSAKYYLTSMQAFVESEQILTPGGFRVTLLQLDSLI